MRAPFIIILICMLCPGFSGRAQGWLWAAGSNGGSEGYGVAVDPWGNVYSSSFASGSVHFGGLTLTGFGVFGTIIAKHDGNGNFLWAKGTGYGYAKPINLAADSRGNLYVLGYYISPTLTIDGFTLHNPASGSELFLMKMAPDGTVQWVNNVCQGTTPGNIVVSGSGVLLAAAFNDPVITVGSFMLTNHDAWGNTTDIVFAKYDSLGNVLTALNFGDVGNDQGCIAATPSGKVYIAGTATSPLITFGGNILFNSDTSMFIARLDTAYNTIWARNETGIGKVGSWVSAIATDSDENAFVCGSWRHAAQIGSQLLPADTACNVYLARFDSSSNISWVKQITGNGQLGGFSVIADLCGHVWLSGGMGDQTPGHHGSNYIKIGNNKFNPPADSPDPMFLTEWSVAGDFIRSEMLPTGGDDLNSIAADGTGSIYVSGDFWQGPFMIGGNTLYDPVQPSENMFVTKFAGTLLDTTRVTHTICTSDSALLQGPAGYTWYRWNDGFDAPSRTVWAPGTYKLYCTGKCGLGVAVHIFTVDTGHLDTSYVHTDTTLCQHARKILNAPGGYKEYVWYDGSTARQDTISAPGTYWVVAKGSCSVPTVVDTFKVDYNNLDLGFSLGGDTLVCAPMLLNAPVPDAAYLWQDGTRGASIEVQHDGAYSLQIEKDGCFNADTVLVSFLDLRQHLHDSIVCREYPVQMKLVADAPAGSDVLWSTGAITDAIWISVPGTYWVRVAEASCVATDTMTLTAVYCTCQAIFPAAFTPNHDGLNDGFGPLIEKNCDVMDYTFCVYNRWGNLVFMSHNIADRWDGDYNDIPQGAGTYMYFVQYSIGTIFNRHLLKGDVLLVR